MSPKLVWIWCLTLIAIPTSTKADELSTWSQRIALGLHLGVDFATIGGSETNDSAVDYSYRTGFTGGGILAARFTPMVGAQLELDFVTKGFRGDTGIASTSGTQNVTYLEVPVLTRITVPVSQRIEPYGYAGPALGFAMTADIELDDGRHIDIKDRIKPFDIGLMFGVGIAASTRDSGTLTIDVRSTLGLRDRSDDDDSEAFNRAIYLTVGYRADLATLGRFFGRGSRPPPAEPAGGAPATVPEPVTTGARR